jgi:hypothetical protein
VICRIDPSTPAGRSSAAVIGLPIPLPVSAQTDASASERHVARKLGYELCPAEVAVQLRLQYLDQPVGEFLNIAMEPIATYEGEPVGLISANGGAGLMIVGQPMSLKDLVDPRTQFVFVRPQQIAHSMLE